MARRLLEFPAIGNLYLQVPQFLLLSGSYCQRSIKVELEGEELQNELIRRQRERDMKEKEKRCFILFLSSSHLLIIRDAEERALQREALNSLYDYEGEDTEYILSISSLWKGYDLYAVCLLRSALWK